MTPLERKILVGVFALREEILARDWNMGGGAYRIEIKNARLGLVATAFAPWAANLAPAGRKAVSRAYAALEALGLIIRHGDGRTTHLSLTPEGEDVARQLAEVSA